MQQACWSVLRSVVFCCSSERLAKLSSALNHQTVVKLQAAAACLPCDLPCSCYCNSEAEVRSGLNHQMVLDLQAAAACSMGLCLASLVHQSLMHCSCQPWMISRNTSPVALHYNIASALAVYTHTLSTACCTPAGGWNSCR